MLVIMFGGGAVLWRVSVHFLKSFFALGGGTGSISYLAGILNVHYSIIGILIHKEWMFGLYMYKHTSIYFKRTRTPFPTTNPSSSSPHPSPSPSPTPVTFTSPVRPQQVFLSAVSASVQVEEDAAALTGITADDKPPEKKSPEIISLSLSPPSKRYEAKKRQWYHYWPDLQNRKPAKFQAPAVLKGKPGSHHTRQTKSNFQCDIIFILP